MKSTICNQEHSYSIDQWEDYYNNCYTVLNEVITVDIITAILEHAIA